MRDGFLYLRKLLLGLADVRSHSELWLRLRAAPRNAHILWGAPVGSLRGAYGGCFFRHGEVDHWSHMRRQKGLAEVKEREDIALGN